MTFARTDIESTVPDRFEAVVREAGDRIALTGNGRQWTYRELNAHANRIAHAIGAVTERRAGCVAFVVDQSPEMVVATIGIMKAGQAYLAVHPAMPAAAQAELFKDAAPDLVIATKATHARVAEQVAGACRVLTLEEMASGGSTDNPARVVRPHDPATIFFTSGTTGRPKGVVRSHRTVLHRVWLSSRCEGVTAADHQSLLTHCSFGASQADLAGALLLGARLCVFDVVPEGLTALADWIDHEQITLLRPPVQLFRRFLAGLDPDRRFPSVTLVSLGGDTVLPADIEAWRRHFTPPCAVLHRFSTTETSLLTAIRIEYEAVVTPDLLAAGHPVDDMTLTLADPDGRPVPAGDEGEIVVSSPHLADGYWRAPEDTARAFSDDPHHAGWRSYRTGDLGRVLPDGRVLFLGRRDHQVKIRGYRVDTIEVESVLRQLDDVADVAVVTSSAEGEQQLTAFVVLRAGRSFDDAALRTRMRSVVPEWKVPAHFRQLATLPTVPNGKLDRQRLRAIADQTEAPVAVATPTGPDAALDALEQQIAAVFQRVLRCGVIDRTSNFFLLGGDSLQATVMHQQIEQAIGRRFPLEALIKDATVRGIADVVRRTDQPVAAGANGRPPILVPLRATGAQIPLFLVHGRLGVAFVSPHLLETFGADQPVYAFQVPGLDPARIPQNTIEEMAREYVSAMRSVQPAGPYFLGAACAGALIAAEMANQLRRIGERVGPLLFIDPPVVPPGDGSWWERTMAMARARLKQRLPRAMLARRWVRTQEWRVEIGLAPLKLDDTISLQSAVEALLMFEIARLKYRHWQYDGPVLMLRSASRLRHDGPTKRGPFGRHLTGDVQWFKVGSHHYSVREAGNRAMAESLRRAVEIAQRAMAAPT